MLRGSIQFVKKELSRLALGSSLFSPPNREFAYSMLDQYVRLGGTMLETAHSYGDGDCERIIGQWMTDHNMRDRITLITKGCHHFDLRSRLEGLMSLCRIPLPCACASPSQIWMNMFNASSNWSSSLSITLSSVLLCKSPWQWTANRHQNAQSEWFWRCWDAVTEPTHALRVETGSPLHWKNSIPALLRQHQFPSVHPGTSKARPCHHDRFLQSLCIAGGWN